MPLYEYECAKCGHLFEKIESVSASRVKKCPKCGGKAPRRLSAPAIQFKGSGWYVTDYGGKSAPPAAEKSETPASAAESKDGGKQKPDAKEHAAKESPKKSKKE
ncbi:MAG: FmdB family zinc ribbon protein [Candidatus Acidiferrales bacterium]